MPTLEPKKLIWAALLGRWVDFARSALALPHDAAGRRLRQSVPDIIALQAVWFALQQLPELDAAERDLGLDRAEILIQKHAAVLGRRYRGREMPKPLRGLLADARRALASGRVERKRGRACTRG